MALYTKPDQEMLPVTDETPCTAVVAVAASAGGIGALKILLGALPADIPAAVLIVQHLDPNRESMIVDILQRSASLQIKQAAESDRIQAGWVYVAPPNHHLLAASPLHLTLSQAPPRRFVRPSADMLFTSVAAHFGGRALAVVLTGAGRDGDLGIQDIKRAGGVAIAQNPDSAEFPSMPTAAINTGLIDHIATLEDIAPLLVSLLAQLDGNP